MEHKIPTADELFKKWSELYHFEEGPPEYLIDKEDFKNALTEFTRLHVETAMSKSRIVTLENVKCDMFEECLVVNHDYIESYTKQYLDNLEI